MAKYTGIVKWYNTDKGYGFISCNEGNDVFELFTTTPFLYYYIN